MNYAPFVDSMMIRRFTPRGACELFGGVLVMDLYDVEEIGLATARTSYDEAVVDCSHRIFQITNMMIMNGKPLDLSAFPSRRWINFRNGEFITGLPDEDHPLLYVGNPIQLSATTDGILVGRLPEFLINSGVELGY